MAGLLPGVDCARRRRLHCDGVGMLSNSPSMFVGGWSKWSSYYMTSHEAPHASTNTRRHAGGGYSTDDANLGRVAREAKERLDGKLRSFLLKPDLRRSGFGANGQSSTHAVVVRTPQTEMFGTGKDVNIGSDSGQVGAKWGRMRWKSTEQEECAVCLERFRVGESLVNLKCAHRFHTRCLVPWIETNSRCPCCRMDVSSPSPPLKLSTYHLITS